jgi:hypothetical protein
MHQEVIAVKVIKGCLASTSAATTVTVNPLPGSAITPAGPIVLCGGGTQLLTAAPSGGTSHTYGLKTELMLQQLSTYTASTAGYIQSDCFERWMY